MPTNCLLIHGDCVQAMREMAENSVDAVVCDPPYGLRFMGKKWDDSGDGPAQQEWHRRWVIEAFRVLKPGGHLVAFGGSRTYHRLVCALEDAGFEIRDSLMWLYGTGFPKSLDVSKAIDKAAGAERTEERPYVAPTDNAKQWEGWGTALKPAHEPIVLARKPLEGTVAANVQKWGTGALNINGCRVGTEAVTTHSRGSNGAFPKRPTERSAAESGRTKDQAEDLDTESARTGRWPANVVLDEEAGAMLDAQSGTSKSPSKVVQGGKRINGGRFAATGGEPPDRHTVVPGFGDSGGASRFFYSAKTSKSERGAGNNHPTVKPVALMRWLVRLVTPPGGRVLDPFCGSGSTGLAAREEGVDFIGIERETAYVDIARQRLALDESQVKVAAPAASSELPSEEANEEPSPSEEEPESPQSGNEAVESSPTEPSAPEPSPVEARPARSDGQTDDHPF